MRRLLVLGVLAATACAGARDVDAEWPAADGPLGRGKSAPRPQPRASAAPRPAAPTWPPPIDENAIAAVSQTRAFRVGHPQQLTPTPDGTAVLFLRAAGGRDPRQSLYKLDAKSGEVREILSPEKLLAGGEDTLSPEEKARRERARTTGGGIGSFELSADGLKILVPMAGKLFVFDRMTGQTKQLPTGKGAIFDPHFSPDGSRVAYVRAFDVWSVGSDGRGPETPITTGGTEAKPHGLSEFVAQEELGRLRGFWFSPDGRAVLYEEADQSKVEHPAIVDPAHPTDEPQRAYYPRAGTPNADVRFGLVSANGGATTWVQWDRARFPYVALVRWEKDAPPVLLVLDREQKNAELLSVDARSGKTTPIAREHDDAWVDVDESVGRFLPGGQEYLWSSDRSGERVLELRRIDTPPDAPGKPLTPKGFGYRSVADVDPDRRQVIVQGSNEPTRQGLHRVSLQGGEPQILGPNPGWVHASFGAAHGLYATYEAATNAFPRFFARTLEGKAVEIPHTAERPAALPNVELRTVGADQVRIAIVRPHDAAPRANLPVIDYAYGGPGAQMVVADAHRFVRPQLLADAVGAVVVCIDARGTPNRGREWERALAGKLGTVPVEGHVAVLKELVATLEILGEVDTSRLGVYGWSFGGYFAARAILAHPELFTAAVAGAPPADWRDYDTAYTERFLGLPDKQAAAYSEASLLDLIKTSPSQRPLLVLHGTADDNVYFGSGLKLVDAMVRAGKPAWLVPLVGQTHLVNDAGANQAAWRRTIEFLRAKLAAPQSPVCEDLAVPPSVPAAPVPSGTDPDKRPTHL
jgi:dipeptidyl-peptidase-4